MASGCQAELGATPGPPPNPERGFVSCRVGAFELRCCNEAGLTCTQIAISSSCNRCIAASKLHLR